MQSPRLLASLEDPTALTLPVILAWLELEDRQTLTALFNAADRCRRSYVGDTVHLRGLIEISNHCRRSCHYCGLHKDNRQLTRYRLTTAEILHAAKLAETLGYGTVVLQAGEDLSLTAPYLHELIVEIKRTTSLAVTLSLGERDLSTLQACKNAGADRYLLRFETSDKSLYQQLHPPLTPTDPSRLELLKLLKALGYEVGSGIMVGLPGQTLLSIAQDILLFKELDLDMIGIGPFLPHPQTPLGHLEPLASSTLELLTYKVIALTRLLCQDINIPSTTALNTLNPRDGREQGLTCGANILMPNLTPFPYREFYEIYPHKIRPTETILAYLQDLHQRLATLKRPIGTGPGQRRNGQNR